MKLHGLSPNSYIHVSVSDLYIPTTGLPIMLQKNRWTDHRYMNVEIGTKDARFIFWEDINRIFFAVWDKFISLYIICAKSTVYLVHFMFMALQKAMLALQKEII
jgi:hypothetical protein